MFFLRFLSYLSNALGLLVISIENGVKTQLRASVEEGFSKWGLFMSQ